MNPGGVFMVWWGTACLLYETPVSDELNEKRRDSPERRDTIDK
jgi:hypothetical protein